MGNVLTTTKGFHLLLAKLDGQKSTTYQVVKLLSDRDCQNHQVLTTLKARKAKKEMYLALPDTVAAPEIAMDFAGDNMFPFETKEVTEEQFNALRDLNTTREVEIGVEDVKSKLNSALRSNRDLRKEVTELKAVLAQYEEKFGPLETDEAKQIADREADEEGFVSAESLPDNA